MEIKDIEAKVVAAAKDIESLFQSAGPEFKDAYFEVEAQNRNIFVEMYGVVGQKPVFLPSLRVQHLYDGTIDVVIYSGHIFRGESLDVKDAHLAAKAFNIILVLATKVNQDLGLES